MNNDLVDIEILTDRTDLAGLSADVRADGSLLVCHRCDDVRRIIVGIVVMHESEEAWALCGPCLQQVSPQGQVVS